MGSNPRRPQSSGEQPPWVGDRFPPPLQAHRCRLAGEEGEPGKEDSGVSRGLPCCHPSSQNSPAQDYGRTLHVAGCSLVRACIHAFIHSYLQSTYYVPWDQAIGQYAEVSKTDSCPASILTEDKGEGVYRQTIKPTWFTCSKGNGHRAKTEE